MTPVKITETVLRDGHQSLIATRMKTSEMEPILEKMDSVGYHAMEVWGGATFDASLRFLNENPWDRLRLIRKRVKNTKLQMLLRGQNLLGYKNYPDDVVKEFVKLAVFNGIDIIRTFDALNDLRNIETAILATKAEGAHAQAAISFTVSPVHTIESFIVLAKDMVSMGADSICIKDMSGLLTPYTAFDLVKGLKSSVNVPIEVHSHCTSGLADMTYMKAIEAGVDIIDTAISPFALGTSQPATEAMVAMLNETERKTGLDLKILNDVAEHFAPMREKALETGLMDPKILGMDINTLVYQVPGGMLSNLVSQLKLQNALDKYNDVLKEVPRVREDLGYPPLVTPTSQIIGTQAVLNVITGERYKMVPNEVKAYVKGMYGRPAVPIKDEIIRKIIGNEEVITCRPADLLEPVLEAKEKEIGMYMESPEDVLTYVLFPQVALDFFKLRMAEKYSIDNTLVDSEQNVYPI
ncbi:oxaloacetate decarboxylase subunit alpha [Acidaminobacter sp.]|uniref:oxaloacetate decarboxylase subunit alpha n=1 Tax=Acidaminobacter sp. TaxID=1872102 RepID=UPI001382791F|nr:oxaloacetate decarboxylase subunit alpha [Acidaminobacter sp.]MDK9709702.1 oxaloacetate decarboxylase subunit alpha [Acidaminobacter sp.]MZQ96941.1 oxaloacetate decarboxylase subunit alpha [Acidaminobacter sp.]